jgi:beta-lactamase regulating signal transducer with metallopeptidase domain
MNALAHAISPEVLRTLGLTLVHFLWQGAALALVAAGALAVARTASVRYVIGIAALILMVAAPIVTFSVLISSNSSSLPADISSIGAISAAKPFHLSLQPGIASYKRGLSVSYLSWVVQLWFVGVLALSLRTAGGFFLIARLRRRDATPVNDELLELCTDIQQALGLYRVVRYCKSLHLDAPAVIGWFRPVVLIPVKTLTGLTEAQLSTILAHEIAHIRRFDAFFNAFQVLAEVVLFYHPAVWWLTKRVRTERENCCDDIALAYCGNPSEYARALTLMAEWRQAPSLVLAANRGPLAARIGRLLGLNDTRTDLRSAGAAIGALCVAAALFAGNALFGLVRPASGHDTPAPQVKAAPAPQPTPAPKSAVITVTATRLAPLAHPAPQEIAPEPHPAAETQDSSKKSSYIEGLKAEGFDNLTADELIALKVQGVTPEYIRAIRAEGLKPNIDELIGMKVQGITPEYIHQVRALKFDVSISSLIGLKVQGVTPEYVESMRKIGFQPDADQIMGLKVQGVTPEYVEQMRKLGFQPDADQIIGLKVQGVTPEYVHSLNEVGLHPDADDIIGLKVQGVDADYIRGIRATGITPDQDEWIALRVHGATAEYIKGLQAAGFKPDAGDVISARVMGLTPDFIEKVRSHGFKNLDIKKLIMLKQTGVFD